MLMSIRCVAAKAAVVEPELRHPALLLLSNIKPVLAVSGNQRFVKILGV